MSSSESRFATTATGTDMIDFEDSDSEHGTTSFERKSSFAAGHDMPIEADDDEEVIVHEHATTDVSSSAQDASLAREHAQTIVTSTPRQTDTTLEQHVLVEDYTEDAATVRDRSLRTVPSQATLVEGQWEAGIAKHEEALVVTHHESVLDAHYDVDYEDEEEEDVEVIRPAPPSGPVLRIFEEPLDGEFVEEETEEVEVEADVVREHVVATLHGDYARVESAQETQESRTTRSLVHTESVPTTGGHAHSKGSHLSGIGVTHVPSSISCHCGVKQSASPNVPVSVAHPPPPLVSFSVSISSNTSIERTIALALVDEQSCGNGGTVVRCT